MALEKRPVVINVCCVHTGAQQLDRLTVYKVSVLLDIPMLLLVGADGFRELSTSIPARWTVDRLVPTTCLSL